MPPWRVELKLLIKLFAIIVLINATAHYAATHVWSGHEVLVALASALLTCAVIYFMFTRRITAINQGLDTMISGGGTANLPVDGADELGDLARTLNTMHEQWDVNRKLVGTTSAASIRQVEKLVTLGEMASSLAHEIKNPLAGISGAIQVIAEDMAEEDESKPVMQEILSEIDRLDTAVRDLLSYARPPDLHPINVPLLSMLHLLAEDIMNNTNNIHIDVKILPTDADISVFVDPDQIHQALMNIMSFCLKSMPAGGEILYEVSTDVHESAVELLIVDSGEGLDSKGLEAIFKPFKPSRHSGIGIGMAISKSIIERHGGKATAESSPGGGTTFHITLPAADKNA